MTRRLWHGITRHFRSRSIEWVLTGVLIIQALQLLSAQDLASNRVYHVLASMVHEYTLARIAFALGATWLLALVLNGTFVRFRRISPWVRAVVALLSACYWLLWSVTLFKATGPVTSVSWINHAALSLFAALCFVWIGEEVGVVDERAAACRSRSPKAG